jgi:hypothetical protein
MYPSTGARNLRSLVFLNFSFIYQNPKVTARGAQKRCSLFGLAIMAPVCKRLIREKETELLGDGGLSLAVCNCAVRMEPNKQTILLCIFHLGLQLTKFVSCSFLYTGSRYRLWERLRLVLIFIFVSSFADPDPVGSA